MRDSVFKSAFRSFLIALFSVIGIFAAFIVIILMFSAASESGKEIERQYKTEILANANGVRKIQPNTAPVILKLNIDGIIGTELLSGNTIRQQLIESREGDLKGDRVKGVLLYVNSPGGGAIDSDTIYRIIRGYKEQYNVPVYAFIDGICASGSLYVAVAADKIYATDSSLIGSVGVIIGRPFLNVTNALEKIGVESLIISSGKGKDNLSPFKNWEPGEKKNVQEITNYLYDLFVNIVASERPLITRAKLINDYGANLFNPIQAKEHGFIDGTGFNYSSALKELLKELGIEDDFYQVVQLQSKKWYVELFKSENSLLKGRIKHELLLPGELDVASKSPFLYLYSPTN